MLTRPLPLPGAAAPPGYRPSRFGRLRGAGTFAAALALHVGAFGHWANVPTPPVPLPTAPLVVDLLGPAPPVPMTTAAPQPEPEPPAPAVPESAAPEPPPLPTPAPLAITPPPRPVPKPRSVGQTPQPRASVKPRPAPPVATRSDAAPSPLPPAPAPVAAPSAEPARFDAAYLRNPPPRYPPESRAAGEAGRVLLRVSVSADGRAESVELAVSSGHDRLDAAALAAVRRWRFAPARQGGEAVAATVTVPILFKLES